MFVQVSMAATGLNHEVLHVVLGQYIWKNFASEIVPFDFIGFASSDSPLKLSKSVPHSDTYLHVYSVVSSCFVHQP